MAQSVAMTLQQEITVMQERIVKAEAERDGWRSSSMQEKYLEAYSMVEALELQLERLRAAALPALLRTAKTPRSDT